MENQQFTAQERFIHRTAMSSFLQIAALVGLVWVCIRIIGPFASLVIWGIILAIAVYPLHLRLSSMFGGNPKASAFLIGGAGLLLLLVPGWLLVVSSVDSVRTLAEGLRDDTLVIPAPDDGVADWPLIGDQVYAAWSAASENLAETLEDYRPQLRSASEWLLRAAGGLILGLLHFAVSIVIAGVMLMYPQQGYELSRRICDRISTGRGRHLTDLSIATVRSVTNGVLGVAVIQAGLAAVGFVMIGLPAPGVLTLIVLIMAVVQLPAILLMLPLIGWVYSFAAPVPATVFAVYALVVALSDNLLKPLLLGRGVDLPVLVVLIGAIGGMFTFGVIGLFLGAVILGVGYRIITDWIWSTGAPESSDDPRQGVNPSPAGQ